MITKTNPDIANRKAYILLAKGNVRNFLNYLNNLIVGQKRKKIVNLKLSRINVNFTMIFEFPGCITSISA